MIRSLCVVILAFFCLSAPTGAAPEKKPVVEKIFNAESYMLDNGLQVVVIPNHRAPVVTQMVWYKTGAADELRGKSGIAHFLEHLMFKGSEGLAPGEFSKKIRAMGGNDNAFTSYDYTAYFQSVPVQKLESIMRMEAGRMRGLALPPEEVESERNVILEERRWRVENDPQSRFSEPMNAALFTNHPYGIPVIGWRHEMETLSHQDALDYYNHHYGPNNAILIVSGDVTGEQVLELAKKIYGPLEKIDLPDRTRTLSPPIEAQVTVRMKDPALREPMAEEVFRAPGFRQNHKESLALEVLEEIMSGGPTSRLYKSLVVEKKIATAAGLSYNGDVWDDGTVALYANPAPGQKPEDVLAALQDELRKLVKDGVTDQEITEAVTRMQSAAIYARDSLSGPAMIFGYSLATGSTVDDVENWPQNIASVTAQDILDAAKKHLDPDHPGPHPPVTGYLLPDENAQGEAAPALPQPQGDLR